MDAGAIGREQMGRRSAGMPTKIDGHDIGALAEAIAACTSWFRKRRWLSSPNTVQGGKGPLSFNGGRTKPTGITYRRRHKAERQAKKGCQAHKEGLVSA